MTKIQYLNVQKHTFALFSPQHLGDLKAGRTISLRDDELHRRIYKVLRLNKEEEVILFDGKQHVEIALAQTSKKGFIEGRVKQASISQFLAPQINLYVGLTKKDAFKEIVYFAAQMGAASITPLFTEKVQRRWDGDREKEKYGKIMIAACEQAKQFGVPKVHDPVSLAGALEDADDTKLFFESHGKSLLPFIQENSQISQPISLFIGPEGGFTQGEQSNLQQSGADCYKLTPTILRSQEAVAVVLGILRSL